MNRLESDRTTVVIFYSSIGSGHVSAAQTIQREILRLEPTTCVVLQDIRAFMNPAWRTVDERLYWFIANHLPATFETLFRSMQIRGNRVCSLASLPNDYPEEKVLTFLESQQPNAVLATHYGAAQVLGTLRERGLLLSMRIGWLHTDFFEGYFPRISKRIDRTFLAHAELESRWLAAGVPRDKVVTTGMPVRIPADEPGARQNAVAQLGLRADTPTLLLTGGKEGAGEYQAVVESVVRECQGRLQIIAVCGTNAKLQAHLAGLTEHMPPQVTLKVLGLLPHEDMVSLIRAADVLVTKAGGMTPSEAFAMGTPTILLDVVSGHERENAAMFARLGLAQRAANAAQIGRLAARLIADPRARAAMLDAQREFRHGIQMPDIAAFALDESFTPARWPADFGAENGVPVTDIDEALARLDAEAEADIEVLLSFSTSKAPQRIVIENPFGHLAIRVGDTVYSANYIADRETDPNFLQHMGLADYLYGVQRPSSSQVHANTYGMAYGRETVGLRVARIPAQRTAAMAVEAHRIEDAFRLGTLRWDRNDFNCADVVARILHAGGYGNDTLVDRLGLPAMPLDVFENVRAVFEDDPFLCVNVVAYRQVPGSQTSYRFARFPLSLGQPLRSVARVLRDASRDPLELAVSKQVAAYFGDRRLMVDDLRILGLSCDPGEASKPDPAHARLEPALGADLRRLLSAYVKMPVKDMEESGILAVIQEIRGLIDRGLETRGWRTASVLAYFRRRHSIEPAEARPASPSEQPNGATGYCVGDLDGATPSAQSTRPVSWPKWRSS